MSGAAGVPVWAKLLFYTGQAISQWIFDFTAGFVTGVINKNLLRK